MGVAKLELGIDMSARNVYCGLPLSPTTALNGNKTIMRTTTGWTIIQRNSGGVDYVEVRNNANVTVITLYESSGPTKAGTYATPDDFGTICEMDTTATAYDYLTRDVSVKIYAITEDKEVIEAFSKEEVEALFGTVSGVVPVTRGGTGATDAANARTNLGITPANIGAAPSSHNHAASAINSGTLSTDRLPTVPITKGGTGATTAANARTNLGITPANIGAAASSHNHAASAINSGTLSSDRLPTVPISKGGTGQTSVAAARNAFGLGNTSGAVPVANGGTGATTAANARTNLGVKLTQLYSGTFKSGSMTFSLNYDFFIIYGKAGGTYHEMAVVPKAAIGTSEGYVLFSDNDAWFGFTLKYSGTTVTLKFQKNADYVGNTLTVGQIEKVYGVNG